MSYAANGLIVIGNMSIDGRIELTGTQPAATADPGANNILIATLIPKAWGNISVGGGSVTLNDGCNIASVAFASSSITVTFARAMANANYAVLFGMESTGTEVTADGQLGAPFLNSVGGTKTTSAFVFSLWNEGTNALVDPADASAR